MRSDSAISHSMSVVYQAPSSSCLNSPSKTTSQSPSIRRGSRIVPIIPLWMPTLAYLSFSTITFTSSYSFILPHFLLNSVAGVVKMIFPPGYTIHPVWKVKVVPCPVLPGSSTLIVILCPCLSSIPSLKSPPTYFFKATSSIVLRMYSESIISYPLELKNFFFASFTKA